jgi:AcrR family transcriptional regulator
MRRKCCLYFLSMKRAGGGKRSHKHRYAAHSSYARGAETRSRLIDSAFKLFARRGFDGASTREIAAAAGTNAPALQYYFDNKLGLYEACGEQVGAGVWAMVQGSVTRAEQLLAAGADDGALIEAVCDIQSTMAEFLSGLSSDWLLWVARDQADLGARPAGRPAYPHTERMVRVYAAIIARLRRIAASDSECTVRAMCLNGQLLFFFFMRRRALAALGWKRIAPDKLELIKDVARMHTLTVLESLCGKRRAATRRPAIPRRPAVPATAAPPRRRTVRSARAGR